MDLLFYIEDEKNLIFCKEGDKYTLREMVTIFEREYKIPSHVAEKDIINFTLNCSFSIHIKNILKDLGFDGEKIAGL